MDKNTALDVINALANGINPETGEVIADESYFNQPQVIRALFLAKESIEKVIYTEKRKSEAPENAGKPWKSDEDTMLSNGYDSGMGMDELSKAHKRTKGSIAARLVRLGKIDERSDVYIRE